MSAHIIHISHVCANTYKPRLTSFFWILEDGVNSLKFPVQKKLKCHKLQHFLNEMMKSYVLSRGHDIYARFGGNQIGPLKELLQEISLMAISQCLKR